MTNEEVIAYLVKENLEFKNLLKDICADATNIHGVLYSVGGGLNDNVKRYNQDQMYDLFRIAELADSIRTLSDLEGYYKYNED